MNTNKVISHRIGSKPLLQPDPHHLWEAGGVFAPAVIYDGKRYRMLYRAVGTDAVSRLGYAESDDGIQWIKNPVPRVVPRHNDRQEKRGLEDPRIVQLNDGFYIAYTAAWGKFVKRVWRWSTRIRFLKTTDFYTFERIKPRLHRVKYRDDKDGVLYPHSIKEHYWLLHRAPPNIQVASSKNLVDWTDHGDILKRTRNEWESVKVGAGAPPILTPLGWLVFYHAVSHAKHYSIGAAVFAAEDPAQLLYRLPYPILEPETDYELRGGVSNVVFVTSALDMGDHYRLYYGAADYVIAAAEVPKTNLLQELQAHPATPFA